MMNVRRNFFSTNDRKIEITEQSSVEYDRARAGTKDNNTLFCTKELATRLGEGPDVDIYIKFRKTSDNVYAVNSTFTLPNSNGPRPASPQPRAPSPDYFGNVQAQAAAAPVARPMRGPLGALPHLVAVSLRGWKRLLGFHEWPAYPANNVGEIRR